MKKEPIQERVNKLEKDAFRITAKAEKILKEAKKTTKEYENGKK